MYHSNLIKKQYDSDDIVIRIYKNEENLTIGFRKIKD